MGHDHNSKTSIMSKKDIFESGIKQTREIVVDYDHRLDDYDQCIQLQTLSNKV